MKPFLPFVLSVLSVLPVLSVCAQTKFPNTVQVPTIIITNGSPSSGKLWIATNSAGAGFWGTISTSGTPGGANRSIQWNSNSVFQGNSFFQYDPIGLFSEFVGPTISINNGSQTNFMDPSGFGSISADPIILYTSNGVGKVTVTARGDFGPYSTSQSNILDSGFWNKPWRTNFAGQGSFKTGIDIGVGSGDVAKLALGDAGGVNAFQFEAPPAFTTGMVYRVNSTTNNGIVSAVFVGVSSAGIVTNRWTNLIGTAGQVLSWHDGAPAWTNGPSSSGADTWERQRQIANVAQLSKFIVPIPVTFSNNWSNYGSGYGTVRLVRDWTSTFVEGAAGNVSGSAAASTIFFVPWGYRLAEGYPGGPMPYSTTTVLSQNAWVHADSRFASSYNMLDLVIANISARWLSTAYYLAVRNPSDTNACLLIPPNLTNATTLVVFFHGNGGNQFDFVNSRDNASNADSNYIVTCKAFLTNGWPLLSHYGQGNAWGNAACLNDYSNSVVWATNALIITNLVFLDGSMGGTAGLPLFGSMPSVSRIYNISPVCSLSNMYYLGGSATFSNEINTAFATTAANFTADTASYDPYRLATNAYGGRNVRFSVSPSDTVVATNLHAYLWTNKFYSASITVTQSTGDHAAPGQALPADIINYFR